MKRLLLALLFLAGCTTPQQQQQQVVVSSRGYDQAMQSWIGEDINNLISVWGAPKETFKMPNGNSLYTYVRDYGSSSSAMGSQYGNFALAQSQVNQCKTSFTVDKKGIIKVYQFEGNACVNPEKH